MSRPLESYVLELVWEFYANYVESDSSKKEEKYEEIAIPRYYLRMRYRG